jgi:hypothetical protein
MNRFTNLSVSRFDPLAWEDIARVPLAKRTEHNARQLALSELDTNIGKIDNLDVHDEQARTLQQEYREKLENLSTTLSNEGVNGFNTQEILKLNSQYKKDWAPGGRAYKITNAKSIFDSTKKEFLKTALAQGNDMNVANELWQKHVKKYGQGVNEEGDIKNIDPLFMGKFINVQKDIDDKLKLAVTNTTKGLEGHSFKIKQYPTGQYYVEHIVNGKLKKSNADTLNAAIDELKFDYSQGTKKQFVDDYRMDVDTMINGARDKFLINSVDESRRINRQNLASPAEHTEIKKKGIDDIIIPTGDNSVDSLSGAINKIQKLESNILNYAGKPNAHQKIKIDMANKRDLMNRIAEAEIVANNNERYIEANERKKLTKVDSLSKLKTVLENTPNDNLKTYILANIENINNEKPVYIDPHYNFNEDVTSALLEYNSTYNKSKRIKEEILDDYMKSHGRETFEIRSLSASIKDSKEFNFKVNKFVKDNSFLKPELITKGLFTKANFTRDKTFNNTVKGLEKEVWDKLTDGSSTNVAANFVVDGNKVSLKIRGQLPKGYKFNTSINDGVRDKTVGDAETVEMEVQLTSISPEGISSVTPAAYQIIAASNLSAKNKNDLIEKVYTSVIKPTRSKEELGNLPFSKNMFGEQSKNFTKQEGLDLLLDESGEFSTVYEINKDTGESKPIKMRNVIKNFDNTYDTFKYLDRYGIIKTFQEKVSKMTVNDVLHQMETGEIDPSASLRSALINYKNSGVTKMSEVLGIDGDYEMNDEQKSIFVNFIQNSNLIIGDPTNLIPKY